MTIQNSKCRYIFIALLASAIGGLQAQDTLTMADPKPCYYAPHWTTTDTVASAIGMRLSYAFKNIRNASRGTCFLAISAIYMP